MIKNIDCELRKLSSRINICSVVVNGKITLANHIGKDLIKYFKDYSFQSEDLTDNFNHLLDITTRIFGKKKTLYSIKKTLHSIDLEHMNINRRTKLKEFVGLRK